jgi:hypothetical protein
MTATITSTTTIRVSSPSQRALRRLFAPALAGLLLGIAGCGGGGDGRSVNAIAPPPSATVEGPIAGDYFISATSIPLADVGYEQAEYFVAGTAHSYVARGALGSDGRWQVNAADEAAYKTRIVVHRPIKAGDFNGTVVIEWLNVSGGLDAAPDWVMAHNELIRSGYAWVGVSAQKVGIDGGSGGLVNLSLKTVNPDRYGSLVHPGDSFSYDMYSQIARAVLEPGTVDPLGGLEVQHAIAAGESQSAFRLTTYVNAFAPIDKLFDGYLIHSRGGGSAALSQAPQAEVDTPDVVLIRSDLDVPVLTVQTESDLFLLGSYPDRQPDSDRFRLWEIAGTAHADTYTVAGAADLGDNPDYADVIETDSPVPGIITCDVPINSGPQHFVVSSAFAALRDWIVGGVAPAMAGRLEVDPTGTSYLYDDRGNVLGGIRTPYVDVPIARLSGEGQGGSGFCFLFGTTELFDDTTLATLYPTHADYVNAVNNSVDAAVANRFLLAPDGAVIKAAAQRSDIGN